MKKAISPYLAFFLLIPGILCSCKKPGFLDKPSSSKLVLPNTLSSLQALLDNSEIMEQTPMLGELSADNFYLGYTLWQGLPSEEHNGYIWAADVFDGQTGIADWDLPYQQVFYANTVLAALGALTINSDSLQEAGEIQGSALFIRAYAFHQLAQVFCNSYDPATASTDLGLPLRLNPDIDPPSVRSTVQQTYDRILSDLVQARNILPSTVPKNFRNRPSLPAMLAFKARVYLSMREYSLAGLCADSCLKLYDSLMDYNSLIGSMTLAITNLNRETLYQGSFPLNITALLGIVSQYCVIDSTLFRSYGPEDLRPSVFFTTNVLGQPIAKGSYNGTIYPFSGLAIDEILLIRAECYARAGNAIAAMTDLNILLFNRWKTGSFQPLTAAGPGEALALVLTERRKELLMRGLRWTDLRRLNKEGAGITLTRVLDGKVYQLAPGDPKYILPIPPDVIAGSGMQQNPR